MNDLEAGAAYNPARHVNKKMKTRKQLDALLKSRSARSNRSSNAVVHSSEDELLLPHKRTPFTLHPQSSRYRRWCSYTRHILSFCLVCTFMIVCVGLGYANIELKNEVQDLSSRVTEIEKRFSTLEISRVISSIEQLRSRLSLIERWNVSYIYGRLQKLQTDFNQMNRNGLSAESSMQNEEMDVSSKLGKIEEKSTHFSEVADELEKLSREADNQVTDMVTEKTKPFDRTLIEHLLEQERRENTNQDTNQLAKSIASLNESFYTNAIQWREELKSLRSNLDSLNQTSKIQKLMVQFQELESFMRNTTEKTSTITAMMQTDLDKLRAQIETCLCSKESIQMKPSIVDTDRLRQSLVTKPTPVDKSSSSSTTSTTVISNDHDPSRETARKETIDIAQIMNPPVDTS